MSDPQTKDEVIALIQNARGALQALLEALPEERWLQPALNDGWTVKDLLAHITDWEGRMRLWIEQSLRGETPEQPAPGLTWSDLDRLNQESYLAQRERPLDEVRSAFTNSYERSLALVQTLQEDDLFDPARFDWREGSPLWEMIAANTWLHYDEHAADLRAWLERTTSTRPAPDPITIRPLTAADARVYRQLRLQALQQFPEAFGSSYEETVVLAMEEIESRLDGYDNQSEFLLGGFLGDRLVGTVGFYRHKPLKRRHTGTIYGMYVDPTFQGAGYGRQLLADAIQRVRRLEGMDALLLTVNVENLPAQRLYARLGFITYGIERRSLRVGERYYDEALMRLDLQEAAET